MMWPDNTRHKKFNRRFYSPRVLYNAEFQSYKSTHMQNDLELPLQNDVAIMTSSLSSSPAIVRNFTIPNLSKFVSIS